VRSGIDDVVKQQAVRENPHPEKHRVRHPIVALHCISTVFNPQGFIHVQNLQLSEQEDRPDDSGVRGVLRDAPRTADFESGAGADSL
jgi:hypothetical protein